LIAAIKPISPARTAPRGRTLDRFAWSGAQGRASPGRASSARRWVLGTGKRRGGGAALSGRQRLFRRWGSL